MMVSVSHSRYLEWLQGKRPLPGCSPKDARFFFATQVEVGMLTDREAYELLVRHQRRIL